MIVLDVIYIEMFICLLLEMFHRFNIVSEHVRQYRRFNATGTQITVRLNPPTELSQSITSPEGDINPPTPPTPTHTEHDNPTTSNNIPTMPTGDLPGPSVSS